jgi:hypothetical protein
VPPGIANQYALLLMQHDDFDGCQDGRLREDAFSVSVRRLQRKWERANVLPSREVKHRPSVAGQISAPKTSLQLNKGVAVN